MKKELTDLETDVPQNAEEQITRAMERLETIKKHTDILSSYHELSIEEHDYHCRYIQEIIDPQDIAETWFDAAFNKQLLRPFSMEELRESRVTRMKSTLEVSNADESRWRASLYVHDTYVAFKLQHFFSGDDETVYH